MLYFSLYKLLSAIEHPFCLCNEKRVRYTVTEELLFERGGDVSPGEKVKRLRAAKGWTQEELKRRSGLGGSTIAHIELGNREQLRPDTIKKLSAVFDVPKEYFLTDDPQEYARVRLATLPASLSAQLTTPGKRASWLLKELEEKWGIQFNYTEVADQLGVAPRFLLSGFDGTVEFEGYMLNGVARITGIPPVWFMTGEADVRPRRLSEQYEEVLLLAQEAGIDPEILKQQVNILRAIAKPGGA